jgi:predicted membrane channel-forming protein YqfA (hemolysin III family)
MAQQQTSQQALWSFLFEPHGPQKLPPHEEFIQSMTTVISNGFQLPMVFICLRSQFYFEAIIGFCVFVTSTLYHAGETHQIKILGMNPGQWHRLDNIFAIMSVNALFFGLFSAIEGNQLRNARTGEKISNSSREAQAHFKKMQKRMEIMRWASMCFAIWCQEKAPWKEMFTIIPIVIPSLLAIFFYVLDEIKPIYNLKWLLAGISLMGCAIGAFAIGLDDENDWCRIYHGLWHTFVSSSFFCLFQSKLNENVVQGDRKIL